MAKQTKQLIVALDIGTAKVTALIGEVTDEQHIKVIGLGVAASRGLKRGVVVDIDNTVKSIEQAVEAAESMASCQVHAVLTSMTGQHIRSLNSHGIVAIGNQEVTMVDVERVLEAAGAVAIGADQKILHILPREYVIDNQGSIHEPIGMSGVRLEAKVHMITGALSAAQNIVKCVERCQLSVGGMFLQALAASEAVLNEDEKSLGVCLIDIGAGTTDIAVFAHGAIAYTGVIPIAGDQVTSDIAIALSTPTNSAEQIKLTHGSAVLELSDPNALIEVDGVAGRPTRSISHQAITEVVHSRYAEIFALVKANLQQNGFDMMPPAGIVLTGGAVKLKGVVALAESFFEVPVRLAAPEGVEAGEANLHDPAYATGIGLLQMGQKQLYKPATSRVLSQGASQMVSKVRNWLKRHF